MILAREISDAKMSSFSSDFETLALNINFLAFSLRIINEFDEECSIYSFNQHIPNRFP